MPRYPKKITLRHTERAVKELDLKNQWNPGAYNTRLVNNRLEFHLLGGRILYWPPVASEDDDEEGEKTP
jgi:hypothetical protein